MHWNQTYLLSACWDGKCGQKGIYKPGAPQTPYWFPNHPQLLGFGSPGSILELWTYGVASQDSALT